MKISISFITISFTLVIFLSTSNCSGFFQSDSRLVNLILKKEGKTYVFSRLGTTLVEAEIAQQKSPAVFPFLRILVDDGVYIQPGDLQEVAGLLGGGYTLHEYPEPSSDGYVTVDSRQHFNLTTENKSTETVGQQIIVFKATLTNAQGATRHISWSQKPMDTDVAPIENCELRSFMIVTNPHPGETVGSKQNFIVVSLDDLVAFFNPGLSVELDEEKQLLFVMEE